MNRTSEVKYVTFKVDGEWLTKFFRTRFWDENCGYENSIRMIKDSLSVDFPEEMCIELLEGRKKLVGVNEFDYVDDNENIRSLSLYIKKQDEKLTIQKIMKTIETYPYNYIDQYACNTSRKGWIVYQQEYFETINEWYEELVYERGNQFDELKNGCIWLEDLEHTARMIMRHTNKTYLEYEEFAEIVFKEYEADIDILRERQIPFEELSDYQQSIICRNQHYVLTHKLGSYNYLGKISLTRLRYRENLKILDPKKKITEEENEFIMDLNTGIGNMGNLFKSEPFDTNFSDPIKGWDGFIDKEGNFYKTKPIGVSWYNGTAYCHMEFAIQYLEEQGITLEKEDEKDYLINVLGWCDYAHYTLTDLGVNVQTPKKLTKAQEKALFKLFELNKDDMTYYFKLLEN